MPSVGFETTIAVSERTQTQVSDRPATGIGSSVYTCTHSVWRFASYSIYWFNVINHKTEKNLAILTIKSKYMKNNLWPVIDDTVCIYS